ncbi:MAG: hypothetical protein SCARUB_04618 [Candidatus Scalindua rubra]|uniref:Uncharacterized protein n=1 Tax=Candidatus Scalindua rubra TaxID=1872076 RepID=A0A1E3X3S7_9BACT|nr:MAG: hypothetical protein SCARUB_04618 [Candidatus Scalindua rubra]
MPGPCLAVENNTQHRPGVHMGCKFLEECKNSRLGSICLRVNKIFVKRFVN